MGYECPSIVANALYRLARDGVRNPAAAQMAASRRWSAATEGRFMPSAEARTSARTAGGSLERPLSDRLLLGEVGFKRI